MKGRFARQQTRCGIIIKPQDGIPGEGVTVAALDEFVAQLETYRQQVQTQRDANSEQASYWHGVRFGLELALLEARKRLFSPTESNAPTAVFCEEVDQLAFDYFEKVLTLCQAPIKRDLLAYNVDQVRFELLRAIHHSADSTSHHDEPQSKLRTSHASVERTMMV